MQTRNWNFKADDKTRDINRWLTGVLAPGRYFGYDFNPTANMNLNLVHTSTGFKDVDHTPAESVFQSLVITRQGVVVKEDAAITINGVANGDATNPRIDIVVLTHQINEVAGGSQALYSIITGTPAATPVAPALTSPNTQIKIGELYVPSGVNALNQAGITWTQNPRPGFAGSGFTANRALISGPDGVATQSVVTSTELAKLSGMTASTAELNRLVGVTVDIQTKFNALDAEDATKQDIITGAASTITSSNLNASIVPVTDAGGKIVNSVVTVTELNKLSGLTTTTTELNLLTGLLASAAELNKLDGATVTTAEINRLAGLTVVIQTKFDSLDADIATKQDTITGAASTITSTNLNASIVPVTDAGGKIVNSAVTVTELNKLSGLTATTTELNKLSGATITTTELNQLAGITGPVTSSPSGSPRMLVKVVQIGDWDMDLTETVSVTHGIADYKKIRNVSVVIRSDDDIQYELLNTMGPSSTSPAGCVSNIGSTTIDLRRVTAEQFDSTGWDSTAFNRGWVTIAYEA